MKGEAFVNIAICDDTQTDRARLRQAINACAVMPVTLHEYDNGEILIQNHKEQPYDLIFLDMIMPAMNGMDIAMTLRTFDKSVPIVFTTISEEFAIRGYKVAALDYLVKPVATQEVKACLEKAAEKNTDGQAITIRYRGVDTQLLLANILYLEGELKYTHIYLVTGDELIVRMKLSDLTTVLDSPMFCRCHKSFLVNLDYVKNIEGEFFTMTNNKKVKISRQHLKEAKKSYFNHVFGKAY